MNADEFLNIITFLTKCFHVSKSLQFLNIISEGSLVSTVVEKIIVLIPHGPIQGMHICSMAQIYPEDRGTNYAIREVEK